ncbi:MAG: GNAT family N-acetyltransferase [Acidobacteriota bacterium]|nr:GNAT family N-acetyltransferase [Acidobacteriota bacterium]
MPLLTDKTAIRAILRRDPVWGVYALGDLAPRMFPKTQWFSPGFSPGFGPDLALVLHDFDTSILFAIGTGAVREALGHVRWPVHLQVQQDALDEVARYAVIESQCHMWRMGWNGPPEGGRHIDQGQNRTATSARRLGAADVPALLKLYADGEATGESPDFFYPSMVTDGVFFGVYDGGVLVAAAGTHLFAPEEHAVAIGNIYTMRDRRGRGLGATVTRAVLDEVKDGGTVGLNVRAGNHAALHLYESLGFVRHCLFVEGLATVRK